uniref:Uncharacterized protein n=1 Tax=Nelumbo nucifera TaxID=4432 RepID=A0A822Z4W8_NELNU|nr:TPA_asm: hypothetical protein HUJ06_013973 [Nelumbo nucifera]
MICFFTGCVTESARLVKLQTPLENFQRLEEPPPLLGCLNSVFLSKDVFDKLPDEFGAEVNQLKSLFMTAMISGFCKNVFDKLPDELGAEMNQIMSLKLEESVG